MKPRRRLLDELHTARSPGYGQHAPVTAEARMTDLLIDVIIDARLSAQDESLASCLRRQGFPIDNMDVVRRTKNYLAATEAFAKVGRVVRAEIQYEAIVFKARRA